VPRSFNGSSDKVVANAARLYAPGAAFTVAMWLKVPALASSGAADIQLYSEANTGNANNVFGLGSKASVSLSGVRLFIKDSAGITQVDSTGSITAFDNTWHHLVYSQNASGGWKTYVDGVQDLSATYTAALTPNDLTLGALVRSTTANFLNGSLAHVATWNRQFSAGEVMSLAAGLLPSHLGPSHYWPLWGNDSPEPDLGVAAHTSGTLTGTASSAGGKTGRRLLVLA
jgi:Concanavalin A-like lectin/glucanases superfamily